MPKSTTPCVVLLVNWILFAGSITFARAFMSQAQPEIQQAVQAELPAVPLPVIAPEQEKQQANGWILRKMDQIGDENLLNRQPDLAKQPRLPVYEVIPVPADYNAPIIPHPQVNPDFNQGNVPMQPIIGNAFDPMNQGVQQIPKSAVLKQEEELHKKMLLDAKERLKVQRSIEKNFTMPSRYPAVAEAFGERFYLNSRGNFEHPIWHAPHIPVGTLWPLPKHVIRSRYLLQVDAANFHFRLKGHSNAILKSAIDRCHTVITKQMAVSSLGNASLLSPLVQSRALRYVDVMVSHNGRDYPHLHMDESYVLVVQTNGKAFIRANETWGALRGLETFSQIVMRSTDDALFINVTKITDSPRFPHRGLLVDTARHYIEKRTLLLNLDAMAMNKLNVFHWHIVDDSSFPYESRRWPLLSKNGAYHPSMVYSHEDIKEIIEYARFRGIRVIPEFDMPGHTHSWGRGYPDVLTPCYSMALPGGSDLDPSNSFMDGDMKLQFEGHFGPMNPAKQSTFDFIEALLEEVVQLFPDEYLHIGGDEVGYSCWLSNPMIRLLVPGAIQDPRRIYTYFLKRLFDIIDRISLRHKKKVKAQIWQEAFQEQYKEIMWSRITGANASTSVPADTLVQLWFDNPTVSQVTSANYKAIYSACWYLDLVQYGLQWSKYYECDQLFTYAFDQNDPNLLGGEACMWTEYQDDVSVLPRIWPLACATAERLWSHKVSLIRNAAPRIEEQRCRMAARAVPVGVASGPDACPHFSNEHQERKQHKNAELPLSEITNYLSKSAFVACKDAASQMLLDYAVAANLTLSLGLFLFLLGLVVFFGCRYRSFSPLSRCKLMSFSRLSHSKLHKKFLVVCVALVLFSVLLFLTVPLNETAVLRSSTAAKVTRAAPRSARVP